MFGGFGPIICGIIFYIISLNNNDFSVDGKQVLIAIMSTYILAFVHAGASVFNQIDEWPIAKSLLFHLGSLYVVYTVCYLLNSWIPFDFRIILGRFFFKYKLFCKLIQNQDEKRPCHKSDDWG